MKDFSDLQNLWSDQKSVQLPDVNSVLADAKKVQRDLNSKIIIQISILIAVVIFIVALMQVIPFKEATTFLGIGLMASTILVFSAIRLYQVIQMKNINLTSNPRILLLDLEKYYKFQNLVNTRYTLIYFVLMNLAFVLYFSEVLQPVPFLYQVIIIVVYLAWMFFAYFYLGKKHKQKEQLKTQIIIDIIKDIEQHYDA
ncbi:hypothetical protein FLAN108750_08600 [Flavobacterium antarcticum]|uniref:hypothetical protein n=1 Tax=Flavobacterium antarcticum TaxID=271155 RepID=UPI0003B503A8|nr:hypothetical protein [Flavobacterium antarcticum]